MTINENLGFTDYTFGNWLLDCSKLAINWKKDNGVSIFRHDVIGKFIWRCFISLVKYSYWSKFHVNIITVSGVMKIFFHKWLTRNPETENTLVWVLPNIYRLGMLGTPNLTQMSLIKCYWMLQNARITSFTVSELLRENQQGEG